MINQEQIKSAIRWALTGSGPLAVFLISKGLPAGTVNTIAEIAIIVVPMLVSLVWSMFSHTEANAIIKAAAIPDVKAIVITPTPSVSIESVVDDKSQPKVVQG